VSVSSFCRHERNGGCVLLKGPCGPGRKGCVLISGGAKFAARPEMKSKGNKATTEKLKLKTESWKRESKTKS